MRPCACALSCAPSRVLTSRVLTFACAPVFLRFHRAHRRAALFDRARGLGRQADPDAAWKAIERDCAEGRKRGAGGCAEEQEAAARSRWRNHTHVPVH